MMLDSDFVAKDQQGQEEVLFDGGGTSDCYRLIKDNRIYCVKRPKPQCRQSEAYMSLFRKEFELGINLEHPNIVRYFAYDTDGKGPFIRMDYVDGDNLEEFVAQHPDYLNDKNNRKQFLDELFSAITYLHEKGLLHLDLKPRNILITSKGHHVKLIDLGFGWSESFVNDMGYTRDYCAPEQLAAKTKPLSPATDIYALGKILQHFGLAKDSVVQHCLKDDPKESYQSVGELQKAVKRSETTKTALRIGLGLAVALLIGVFVWLVSNKEEPLPPRPAAPEGAINGLFTINEVGDQVYFSKGNLQYIGSADTPYWKFADSQLDYFGDNGQVSTNPDIDRDVFGWGTSGYNHGARFYQPWEQSMDNSNFYAYGIDTCNLYDGDGRADWGYNAIRNGGNKEGLWRTLTIDEWAYIFDLRMTPSRIRFVKARLNNVRGIVLLPDDWDASIYPLNAPNGGYYGSNVILMVDWESYFESRGAVFLPAAGFVKDNAFYHAGAFGYYWSSSSFKNQVGRCDFCEYLLYPYQHDIDRHSGAVRLVRDK